MFDIEIFWNQRFKNFIFLIGLSISICWTVWHLEWEFFFSLFQFFPFHSMRINSSIFEDKKSQGEQTKGKMSKLWSDFNWNVTIFFSARFRFTKLIHHNFQCDYFVISSMHYLSTLRVKVVYEFKITSSTTQYLTSAQEIFLCCSQINSTFQKLPHIKICY